MSLDERIGEELGALASNIEAKLEPALLESVIRGRRQLTRARAALASGFGIGVLLIISTTFFVIRSATPSGFAGPGAGGTLKAEVAPKEFASVYDTDVRYRIASGGYEGKQWTAWAFVQRGTSTPCMTILGFYYGGGKCFAGGFESTSGIDAGGFSGLVYNGPAPLGFVLGFTPRNVAKLKIDDEIHAPVTVPTVATQGMDVRLFVAPMGPVMPIDLPVGGAQPKTTFALYDGRGHRIFVTPSGSPTCRVTDFGDPKLATKSSGAVDIVVPVSARGIASCRTHVDLFLILWGSHGWLPVNGNGDPFTIEANHPGEFTARFEWRNWCTGSPGVVRIAASVNQGPTEPNRQPEQRSTTSVRLPRCVAPGNRSLLTPVPN